MPTTQQEPRSAQREAGGERRTASEQLRLFMIMIFGLVIVAQLELPFRLAGIVLGLAASWIGVRLLIRMSRLRKAGTRARGSVLVSLGLGLSLVLVLTLAAEAAYYPLVDELQKCESGANTQTAQAACRQHTQGRIDDLMNKLRQRR